MKMRKRSQLTAFSCLGVGWKKKMVKNLKYIPNVLL